MPLAPLVLALLGEAGEPPQRVIYRAETEITCLLPIGVPAFPPIERATPQGAADRKGFSSTVPLTLDFDAALVASLQAIR